MIKGGYKIIDLRDKNLTTTSYAYVKGIYEDIESNYRKPLLLSGITIEQVEKADAFVTFTHNGNAYSTSIYGHTITISDNDQITII